MTTTRLAHVALIVLGVAASSAAQGLPRSPRIFVSAPQAPAPAPLPTPFVAPALPPLAVQAVPLPPAPPVPAPLAPAAPIPPAPPSPPDAPAPESAFQYWNGNLKTWKFDTKDWKNFAKDWAFDWAGPAWDGGMIAQLAQQSAQAGGRKQSEVQYDQARMLIEQDRYDRALELLDRVVAERGSRAEAAMYWKAYSQAKLARRDDALATLAELQKEFPKGRWLKDAQALALEVRQAAGRPVSAEGQVDEELKLLALRGLTQTDPEVALPAIEKILTGTSSVRVKDRALFLVSQIGSPRSRALVLGVAKGSSNPDLQLRAIRYLGMMGASDTETLLSLYSADTSVEVRKAVIHGLALQGNGKALVALARAEKTPELKTEIVQRLSMTKSPEARDYLLELLK